MESDSLKAVVEETIHRRSDHVLRTEAVETVIIICFCPPGWRLLSRYRIHS